MDSNLYDWEEAQPLDLDNLLSVHSNVPYPEANMNLLPENWIEPCTNDHNNQIYKPEFYNFQRSIDLKNYSGSSWEYSEKLDKVYIIMDKVVTVLFSFSNDFTQSGFYIRAQPLFSENVHIKEPVVRCPVHLIAINESNQNFMHKEHVLRCEAEECEYETKSSKHSVKLKIPHKNQESFSIPIGYKFVCKTSCKGGMNRRPIHVLFTLENADGLVLASNKLNFQICSIPKRDLQRDEERLSNSDRSTMPHSVWRDQSRLPVKRKLPSVPRSSSVKDSIRQWYDACSNFNMEEKQNILSFIFSFLLMKSEVQSNPTCLAKVKEGLDLIVAGNYG